MKSIFYQLHLNSSHTASILALDVGNCKQTSELSPSVYIPGYDMTTTKAVTNNPQTMFGRDRHEATCLEVLY